MARRVREERVERSRRSHLRLTRAAELRLRVSETAERMLERITSGRSETVVVVRVIPAIIGVGELCVCARFLERDFWRGIEIH